LILIANEPCTVLVATAGTTRRIPRVAISSTTREWRVAFGTRHTGVVLYCAALLCKWVAQRRAWALPSVGTRVCDFEYSAPPGLASANGTIPIADARPAFRRSECCALSIGIAHPASTGAVGLALAIPKSGFQALVVDAAIIGPCLSLKSAIRGRTAVPAGDYSLAAIVDTRERILVVGTGC
jgi:hypothetical protein